MKMWKGSIVSLVLFLVLWLAFGMPGWTQPLFWVAWVVGVVIGAVVNLLDE